jgi:hypothetical protein
MVAALCALFARLARSQTNVGGTSDRHDLTTTESLHGHLDCEVSSGATLTVNAGVIVKVNQNFGITISSGRLALQGTSASGVLITASASPVTRAIAHYGRSLTTGSELHYTRIEAAGAPAAFPADRDFARHADGPRHRRPEGSPGSRWR